MRFAVTVEHGLSIIHGYIQAKECALYKAEEDILGVYFQMQFPQVTPIFLVINFLPNKLIFFFFFTRCRVLLLFFIPTKVPSAKAEELSTSLCYSMVSTFLFPYIPHILRYFVPVYFYHHFHPSANFSNSILLSHIIRTTRLR